MDTFYELNVRATRVYIHTFGSETKKRSELKHRDYDYNHNPFTDRMTRSRILSCSQYSCCATRSLVVVLMAVTFSTIWSNFWQISLFTCLVVSATVFTIFAISWLALVASHWNRNAFEKRCLQKAQWQCDIFLSFLFEDRVFVGNNWISFNEFLGNIMLTSLVLVNNGRKVIFS